MIKIFLLPVVFILFLLIEPGFEKQLTGNTNSKGKFVSCGPGTIFSLADLPRIKHPRLIYPDDKSDFPKVVANDNRVPAGKLNNNTLELNLEVVWSDFYPESNDHPGLRVVTIGEKGKAPSIPAPLIRVETGTQIHAVLHNTLSDSTVTIYGLQKRPSTARDSIVLKPGETKDIRFESGEAGTYLYWLKLWSHFPFVFNQEEEQLAGAFIIDWTTENIDHKNAIRS